MSISDRGFQRKQYDRRFGVTGVYDQQNEDVLLTEHVELQNALGRAITTKLRDGRSGPLTMLDFGFGSGRVSVPLAVAHEGQTDLLVVAYDISHVGLQTAAKRLASQGFSTCTPLDWSPDARSGYVVGDMRRAAGGPDVTVRFVHASETDSARTVDHLLRSAIGGQYFDLTTSLFSPLCHIFGHLHRRAMFEALGRVTHPQGQILFGGPTTGSQPHLQEFWWQRMQNNAIDDLPFDYPGDIVYETGEGFSNVLHPFTVDSVGHMRHTITCDGQRIEVRAILGRGDEPHSREDQIANAKGVSIFNGRRGRQPWSPDHFDDVDGVVLTRDGTNVPDGLPFMPSPFTAERNPETVASQLAAYLHSADRAPFWDYRLRQHQQVLVSTHDSSWIERNDGQAFVDIANTNFDQLPSDIQNDYLNDAHFLVGALASAINTGQILHRPFLVSVASDLQRRGETPSKSRSRAVAELAHASREGQEEVLLGRVNEAVFNLEADRYLRNLGNNFDQENGSTLGISPDCPGSLR